MAEPGWIPAGWPAPDNVRAGTTTRIGGVSTGPWASFNLGDRAGDDRHTVAGNRRRLAALLALPGRPAWLYQVHGTRVVDAARTGTNPEADAAFARGSGTVCAVLTADCLPVLLCDRNGTEVAAAHAGWRGLAGGVLAAAVAAMQAPPDQLLAWLGPAIGPEAFEVGAEVRAAFLRRNPAHRNAFTTAGDKYRADLYAAARNELAVAGVSRVFGGGLCTFHDPERFFSYRRDGACGRMASLIWLQR